MKILSWNNGDSSKLLAEALGVKRLKHEGSKYRPKEGDVIINWGCSHLPRGINIDRTTWLNKLCHVGTVSDKLSFFRKYAVLKPGTFNVPPFFFDKEKAGEWLHQGEGTRTLVARTLTKSCEGKGIVLITNPLDMVDAPLYTGYVKKLWEFRCHVFNGKVISFTKKVQKKTVDGPRGDHRIRNTANDYIFARNFTDVPADVVGEVKRQAIAAVDFYELDFGAVDLIYNQHYNEAYVLEINTAPGIEGTTVTEYADAIKKWILGR